MALGAATIAVLAVCGPGGFDLYGHGWVRLAAAVGGVAAIVAGCWPWYVWQRGFMAGHDGHARWREEMDDLARACGFPSYADCQHTIEVRRRIENGGAWWDDADEVDR